MTRRRIESLAFLLAAATGLVFSGPAPAQTSRPEETPPTTQPAAPPATAPGTSLLSGPRVAPTAIDQAQPRFGGADRARGAVEIRPQRWLRLYRELDLDAAQSARVATLTRELARTSRAFQREHGPALRELRRKLRDAREAGEMPPPELREAMQSLQEKRPPVEETQTKLWELLTAEQQEAFRAKLAAEREKMADQARLRREGGKGARERGGEPKADDEDVTERRLRFLRSRRGG